MTATTPEPVYFLLVDDLDENLLSLDALLRRDDLVLLKARNGAQALELLLKHDVALALLDVQMPDMNGFELAELMRGTERTKRVPIIFLTAGSGDTSRRFRGYEAGAVDFLQKPIEPDVLRSKANVFFELRRQQRLLELQRDRLEEADRRKDEFIATLAHELRNPLAPICNGLQILNLAPNVAEAANIRAMMDRQLTHLVRLIDDLLDVSRVSQGKIDLRKEPVTAQTAVQTAIETARPLIEERKHSLTLTQPEDSLWIEADPTRLAQIVSNLLNNAAKYTPEGGAIELAVRQDGQDVIIAVTDTGLGIHEQMLPRVFEMFTQVHQKGDVVNGGLGIGLSLVKRLLEMHDGSISAESGGAGQGSRFTVRLPLTAKRPAQEQEPVDKKDAESQSALQVLVVDDNIPSAQTIGWMLELIGHTPTLAHDGPEAIKVARSLNPDVILLDIGLPGMTGYEVCRTLRQEPEFADTLFVAQTGWGQDKDKNEAFAAGFDHHLVKPVNMQQFSELLKDVEPKARAA